MMNKDAEKIKKILIKVWNTIRNYQIVFDKETNCYAIRSGWIWYNYMDLIDTHLWHSYEAARNKMVFCRNVDVIGTSFERHILKSHLFDKTITLEKEDANSNKI